MVEEFLNRILLRSSRAQKKQEEFANSIESGFADGCLDILLSLMSFMFYIDKDYRNNIKDFKASYVFTDQAGEMYVAAKFDKNRLKVSNKKVENPTLTLIFKNEQALFKFLLSGSPDVLNALLNQEVDFKGNINYMSKFAFMAMHLMLLVTHKL